MARQLRVEYPGAIYHVTVRANGGQNLFLDDQDRRQFVSWLSECVNTYQVRLYLFCLMTNHTHAVVETPKGNLSRFMHSLLTGYGVGFNRRHGRHGHVTQGRYAARLVQGDKYLLKLSRYVHLNPVKIKRMKDLPLEQRVDRLRRYRWSTYPGYIGRSPRLKTVAYEPMLSLIGGRKRERPEAYREYVESGIAAEEEDFLQALEMSPRSIGSEKFREWVDGVYEGLVDKSKVREDVSFRQKCKRITPEVVLSAVAGCAKVKKDELQKRHRGSTIRGIACRMLCKHGGLRQREAAEVLGIGTGSAVSFQMRKIENMMKSDESLRNLLNSIEKKLARKSRGTN